MSRGAGVLYIAEGRALFLKRAANAADHGGEWCLPGGSIEADETPEQAARREFEEETGHKLTAELKPLTRRIKYDPPQVAPVMGAGSQPIVESPPLAASEAPEGEPVDFTTFLVVGPVFEVKINAEHVGSAWAPIDAPPEPLHPGCRISLKRVTANELDIARMIASGDLISPQKYQNVWLFALRVSGTGVAYRQKLDEYVLRKPEGYLTPDFLARCNGLPILWQHPPTDILTSEEFSKRVIGTMFLPFLDGEEVWGVAKIYNEEAAQRMQDEQLSTSPGVTAAVLLKGTIEIDNGESTLIVEGTPTLNDHLAICKQGVWDKGQEPQGVRAEAKGDSAMAEENKTDAGNQGEMLDKVLAGIDSLRGDMTRRMDAMEEEMKADKKRRADAEEEQKKADAKKRADAAEDEEQHKYADAVRRGDAKKKGSVEGFEEGGVFHPIRSSTGYSKRKAGDSDETYKARHDAEETGEREELKKEGVAEETAADRAKRHRRDAEEEEEKERKAADKAKKDAESAAPGPVEKVPPTNTKADAMNNKELVDRLSRVEAAIPKSVLDADHAAMTDAQARADAVYQAFGKQAPGPLHLETITAYMRRLLAPMQQFSARWKDADLVKISTDSTAFGVVQEQIYADAMLAAAHPADLAEGELRPITKTNPVTGLKYYEFVSNGGTFIGGMMPPIQKARLNASPRSATR